MVHVFVSSEVNLNLNVSFLTLSRYLYANNFYMVVFMNRSPFGAGLNLVINQPLWQSHYLAETLYCSKFFVSSEYFENIDEQPVKDRSCSLVLPVLLTPSLLPSC